MEDHRSHSKLVSSSRRRSAEADTDYAGEGKKNGTPSLKSDECKAAAGTAVTGGWTGEKKTKIQHTPSSGNIGKVVKDDDGQSSGKVVQEQEEGPELLEGLDWGPDELHEKIDCFVQQLKRKLPDSDDDFWIHCDDKQSRELNERLALYRIRAHEEEHRKMEDADLKLIYPASVLETKGYFKFYERNFDWYFDPQYCNYARFQDYQRLVIRNNVSDVFIVQGEYEDWEDYRNACSTLEGDQEFVWLWDKLLSNTKLIESLLTDSSYEDFIWSVRFDNTWYKYYAGFYFEIWKRVAKQKVQFLPGYTK
ncbi:hypothetical protein HU200_003131 [Digitaria exilis]|uniref:Uncharacterized protein n=1 Tax=Digitaria exilis TaxID=1010633 RepID=A0A835FYB1_9POAL|nr:hypothetical protein HU200_003131 [Digitaria exilis]